MLFKSSKRPKIALDSIDIVNEFASEEEFKEAIARIKQSGKLARQAYVANNGGAASPRPSCIYEKVCK